MLPIVKRLIKFNYTPNANKPVYIVVHDTGNKQALANAEMHYRYFNGGDRQASAHYFVDDGNILQLVLDSDKSWHCGDGGGKYGISNSNSIGIEICINQDGNYQKAVSNAIDLVVFLMKKYNIGISNVVRHFDASRKICPGSMAANNWVAWTNFKNEVAKRLNPPAPKKPAPQATKPLIKVEEVKKVEPVDIYKDVPDWAKDVVKKCKEKGYLTDPVGDITFFRILKVLDNMGLIK